jgi:glycosyltransferase involved in cell wall biosynthesis
MNIPIISFVIPLYNEEANFDELSKRASDIAHTLGLTCEILFINDGSSDKTPQLMEELSRRDERFTSVFLSRNYGHQIALSAGLTMARGTEAIMILDGDLQDPPEMVTEFYAKLKEGYDVVYGVRTKRKESKIKKIAYWSFYRLLKSIAQIDLPLDSGDFCMISRRAVNYLNQMPEQNRFIRGMRTWIGFKQIGITYERSARYAGETKYSWKKLFELAYSGIFNFSVFPVKLVTRMGMSAFGLGFIYLLYTLIQKILFNNVPIGFTAIVFSILLFSGVQLISLGIIGEYAYRIYQQVQQRPLFIIDKVIKNKGKIDGQELLS